jgi:hypothetical protein
MKALWIFPLLAACASPAPEFMGAQRIDTEMNGRNYTVFFTEKRAQIIRLGYAKRGEHAGIRADMIALIPQVTGCRLSEYRLQGDSGEMRGSIFCPKK